MKPTVRLVRGGVGLLLFAAFASLPVWAQEQELSHVRIVRLSFTEGTVTLQRADVEEWATAPANTPIQEGFKLSTAESSFAEVEFENSSTARIGQQSLLEFTQLALLPSGGKVNHLTLKQGYATFNVTPEGDDFYEVTVGEATLTPRGKSRFRVDFEQGMLQVKVFKGSVEIASREGNGTLGKNAVLEVRPGEDQPFQISQGITKDAWDEWVEERENRVVMARNQQASAPYSNNVSDLLYGYMDLAFYGDWVSVPGYGYGWTPYANVSWSPFTAGRWCWYPSFGYTWISTEPWGWLPYHYGNWIYEPGYGWVWIPNNFMGWSPAVVSWYRGPGWVGWAPMSPRLGGSSPAGGSLGLNHCPQPRGCVTAVDEDTLRHGRAVLPNRRDDIDSRGGRIVERPEIQPERFARLTGEPRAHGAGYRSGQLENRDAAAAGRVIPNRPSVDSGGGTPPARSSIVFDPEQRRYVNNPSHRSVPAQTGDIGGRGAPATLTHAGRPGPVTNYPVPAATGPDGGRPGFDNRNEPGLIRSAWWDEDESQGRRAPNQDARAGGPRSGERNSSAGSSSRPAPVSVDRSDGGSRSSADRSSSSGGSRSGGDRGASSSRSDNGGGRSSGGYSGGSSSHSSGGSSHSSGGWSGGGGGGSHSSGGGGGGSHSSGGGGGSSSSSSGSHSSGSSRH